MSSARPLRCPRSCSAYTLIADGERGAVVGRSGDFAWMCFPQWDPDALF